MCVFVPWRSCRTVDPSQSLRERCFETDNRHPHHLALLSSLACVHIGVWSLQPDFGCPKVGFNRSVPRESQIDECPPLGPSPTFAVAQTIDQVTFRSAQIQQWHACLSPYMEARRVGSLWKKILVLLFETDPFSIKHQALKPGMPKFHQVSSSFIVRLGVNQLPHTRAKKKIEIPSVLGGSTCSGLNNYRKRWSLPPSIMVSCEVLITEPSSALIIT